jgi:ABC-2 type transport system ATP-binding protein
MSNIIEVDHLVKHYPASDQPAVRGVSFAVRRGEIFGLLGPAGAGKTAIISMLACLRKPNNGRATIAGFDLFRQPNDIKRRCKLVPQKLALCPLLSIQDNLLWYGRLHGLNNGLSKSGIAEVLQLVGLGAGCFTCVDKHSCDTQRRISLAAALLHQPEILLLDDLTRNVDPQNRNCILDTVTELNRRGLTVVSATRDSAVAARLCHRVALIDQGRIVALDTPRALQDMLGGFAALEILEPSLDAVFLALTGKYLRA